MTAGPAATPGAPVVFEPTSQADLAPSGQIARIEANLAALRTLRAVHESERPATADEQHVLARWSGWGAVPQVFDDQQAIAKRYREQLAELLAPDELEAAARNTLNAHYTGADLVQAVWTGVQALGFTGGRVLEPGCGIGNFIGFAPDGSTVTGVEIEPVTAAIARLLYPTADIRTESFAQTRLPDDSYDLAIGNVPFGNYRLHDRAHNRGHHSIHNHFLIKSLHAVRPGGLVAAFTSRYTLDARDPVAREELAELGDLVTAIRLPTDAHRPTAGFEGITDLLIYRRRGQDAPRAAAEWMDTMSLDEFEAHGEIPRINRYFLTHPEQILGQLTQGSNQFSEKALAVASPAEPVADLLSARLGELADQAMRAGLGYRTRTVPSHVAASNPPADDVAPAVSELEEGHLIDRGDQTFAAVAAGQLAPHQVPATQRAELSALLHLRDLTRDLLDAEANTSADAETAPLEQLREQLNTAYDAYTARWGPINRYHQRPTGRTDPATGEPVMARIRPRQGGFRDDPHAPLVAALEVFDPETQGAHKAPIFTQRVIAPRTPATHADTPADALAACLDTYGQVDLAHIAGLLGVEPGEARRQLGQLVFDVPPTTSTTVSDSEGPPEGQDTTRNPPPEFGAGLVPAAEYLSGDVRAKLADARAAAQHDSTFTVNVAALEQVLPRDLEPGEIQARLGASWIDAGYVQQFLTEILDDSTLRVEHPGGPVWTVKGGRSSVASTSTWGTTRVPAPALAQSILEQRPIRVTDEVEDDGRKRQVLNWEATVAAQRKANELSERFSRWAWEEPGRSAELAKVYNRRFNTLVARSYDDHIHAMRLPGLSLAFAPRPHQLAAVARTIAEPATLLAHEVGAGKTAEMVISAMELRRLGLVTKPAIVVPNHMLEQMQREFLQLYPQARVLAASTEDLQGQKRRQFLARCATGNWDAVIMTGSSFSRIPMSKDERHTYLEAEADRIRRWIQASKSQGGLTVKRLQRSIVNGVEKAKEKLDSAVDDGLNFERTGIDYLFVDEAHLYKNLRTGSNILGAAIDGSQRSSDLDMKLSYLRRRNGNRVGCFATATPLANSITEAHVMMRYLRPDLLDQAGVSDFDTFAATFGQVVTAIEVAPEGGFRQSQRFAKFCNVPELLRLWQVFADVKTAEDLQLPTPAIVGGRPETVVLEPSPEQVDYITGLADRAIQVRARTVDPRTDNMLKITGDGRRAALDLRLLGERSSVDGKVEVAADKITAIWRQHRNDTFTDDSDRTHPMPGALQLVFCDDGTPSGRRADRGWNVYDALRERLSARGMPAEQVRFVHEAKTDRDKAEMFAACRDGQVAVLIGSSQKMGVGTNVQQRAVALHHLDCPWRPVDIQQREGRILRQGNQHQQVHLLRYVTEGSFDAYTWQTVSRKARFIDELMRGNINEREVDDIGETTLNYNEVTALATGNPLLLDKANADAELARLQGLAAAHRRDQHHLQQLLTTGSERHAALTSRLNDAETAIGQRRPTRGDAFTATIDTTAHHHRTGAASHLHTNVLAAAEQFTTEQATAEGEPEPVLLGELGGHQLALTTSRHVKSSHEHEQARFLLFLIDVPTRPEHRITFTTADLATGQVKPAGWITRLENQLADLDTVAAQARADLDVLERDLERARQRQGVEFPHAAELAAAQAQAESLADQLAGATNTTAGNGTARPSAIGPRPPKPSRTDQVARPSERAARAVPAGLAPQPHPPRPRQPIPSRPAQPHKIEPTPLGPRRSARGYTP